MTDHWVTQLKLCLADKLKTFERDINQDSIWFLGL